MNIDEYIKQRISGSMRAMEGIEEEEFGGNRGEIVIHRDSQTEDMSSTSFLLVFILIMAVIIMVTGTAKSSGVLDRIMGKNSDTHQENTIDNKNEVVVVRQERNESSEKDKEIQLLKEKVSELENKLKNQSKELDLWADRVWLLGLANNENANLTSRTFSRIGVSSPNYMKVTKDWKVNKVPVTLFMDPEAQERLRQYLRDN